MERIIENYYHIAGKPLDNEIDVHYSEQNYIDARIVYKTGAGYYISLSPVGYGIYNGSRFYVSGWKAERYVAKIIECSRKTKKLSEQAIAYFNENAKRLINEELNITID